MTVQAYNLKGYLERIGLHGHELPPGPVLLSTLQRRHLLSVPFENLDIHWKRPIVLDTERFYKKVIGEGRGGFCYELNGLFNELLKGLGFKTRLVSARVFSADSGLGPEFDHAAIMVSFGDTEYLTDVGFGDFTTEPLRFVLDEEQTDEAETFVIRRGKNDQLEVIKRVGDEWKSQYVFTDIERGLAEFAEMCDVQQFSAESHFTQGKVCSMLTDTGRKTLTDKKFIVTTNGQKTETVVGSAEEFDRILLREFGIASPVAQNHKAFL